MEPCSWRGLASVTHSQLVTAGGQKSLPSQTASGALRGQPVHKASHPLQGHAEEQRPCPTAHLVLVGGCRFSCFPPQLAGKGTSQALAQLPTAVLESPSLEGFGNVAKAVLG